MSTSLIVDDHFRHRLRERHAAAAVVAIAERRVLPREHVAGVQDPERREDDEGIAAGVAGTEVVQIDLVLAGAERQLVLVGLLRQELRVSPLKASIFSMFVFVFSCATISTSAPKKPLFPV